MHRRARHLNPKDAGALVALDSRFGFTVANGSAIGTWEDRTNNNNDAKQATTTKQPTYNTNQLNGNPVITFDGTDDSLRTDALSSSITSNALTCLSMSNKTAQGSTTTAVLSRVFGLTNGNNFDASSTDGLTLLIGSGGGFVAGNYYLYRNNSSVTARTGNYNQTYLHSFTLNGSSVTSRLNNTAQVTGTTSATAMNSNLLALAYAEGGSNAFLNGNLSVITIIPSVVSGALLKRLEHASAYSFKLTCN